MAQGRVPSPTQKSPIFDFCFLVLLSVQRMSRILKHPHTKHTAQIKNASLQNILHFIYIVNELFVIFLVCVCEWMYYLERDKN